MFFSFVCCSYSQLLAGLFKGLIFFGILGSTRIFTVARRVLQLDDNSIGDEGAMAMAMLLRANGALKVLSLNGNGIHLEGALSLAGSVAVLSRTMHGASELWLQGNAISSQGALALASAVKGHKPVRIYHPLIDEAVRELQQQRMASMAAEEQDPISTTAANASASSALRSPFLRAKGLLQSAKAQKENATTVDRLILKEDGSESIRVGQTYPAGILRTATGHRAPEGPQRQRLKQKRRTTFLDELQTPPENAAAAKASGSTGKGSRRHQSGDNTARRHETAAMEGASRRSPQKRSSLLSIKGQSRRGEVFE